jgi:hypothetical protein
VKRAVAEAHSGGQVSSWDVVAMEKEEEEEEEEEAAASFVILCLHVFIPTLILEKT